ncbi:N-acetylmuramoyl-L-alanine amidase family protein [Labilibaculum euxinus]|uniref:N-acetylmuramoyl-L-alanine amidase n=1 Tax=Labilibaculum euxinus TaxID=2686357 RepID=A0A7M4D8Z9_9BACT|nr:N-acetylmuramoyl-L-alanine amidase [Labilibaculum euxinus]MUP39128.1 N-acetylmuramoyl-L-alanine amidase [Labilibaculum euxinus]MVB08333.1 N-acetylmuramoyl-L-alanine amidase [Labilibaculum euxinus]
MIRYILILFTVFLLSIASSFAQENYEWSTAKNGEGFNSFLLRNHISPINDLEKFKDLNQGRFTKNGDLIAGKKYKLPLLYSTHLASLLGEDHQNVKQVDNSLSGAVLYLVAGHGGPDPGAVGSISGHKITEDEYAYDIVLRMGEELLSHGAKVHFIIQDPNDGIRDAAYLKPDKDERCYPSQTIPRKHTPRLKQRAAAINLLARNESKSAYQRLIILHLDSRSKGNSTDVYFYHHAVSSKGKDLALTLQQKMKDKYDEFQPNRGYEGTVGTRRLYMLQTTTPPSVFIELGNINNYNDQMRFIKAENRQALAMWLCEGIQENYLKLKMK